METTVKFNIIDAQESDLTLGKSYANGKIHNLTDEDLTIVIRHVIKESIINNRVYYDIDDIERAIHDVTPTISSIILNSAHIKSDYNMFIELVSYLTIRLA